MKPIFIAIALLVLGATLVQGAQKFSNSTCANAYTDSQTQTEIPSSVLTVQTHGGITRIIFNGNFALRNDVKQTEYIGVDLFLLRDETEILDRAVIRFPLRKKQAVYLPVTLHGFDTPPNGDHRYSILWSAFPDTISVVAVNCRTLTIVQ